MFIFMNVFPWYIYCESCSSCSEDENENRWEDFLIRSDGPGMDGSIAEDKEIVPRIVNSAVNIFSIFTVLLLLSVKWIKEIFQHNWSEQWHHLHILYLIFYMGQSIVEIKITSALTD